MSESSRSPENFPMPAELQHDDVEAMARQREIDQYLDCAVEMKLTRREIMSKHGFKTEKALEEAKSKVGKYLGGATVQRDIFKYEQDPRVIISAPAICPKCGANNGQRIENPTYTLRESK